MKDTGTEKTIDRLLLCRETIETMKAMLFISKGGFAGGALDEMLNALDVAIEAMKERDKEAKMGVVEGQVNINHGGAGGVWS